MVTQTELNTKTAAVWDLFSTKYKVGKIPKIIIKELDTSYLGLADTNVVLINSLYVIAKPALLKPVLVHELAHVIQTRIHGMDVEDHGPEFVEILESFGFNDLTKATIDIKRY